MFVKVKQHNTLIDHLFLFLEIFPNWLIHVFFTSPKWQRFLFLTYFYFKLFLEIVPYICYNLRRHSQIMFWLFTNICTQSFLYLLHEWFLVSWEQLNKCDTYEQLLLNHDNEFKRNYISNLIKTKFV